MKLPLCIPNLGEEEALAVKEVLDSGWLAHGPKVDEFEEKFSEYIGVSNSVAVNSCASALQVAIQAQNIKGEVILPSFTMCASANAIIAAGAKPVFAEIEYESCNIDPLDIEKKITDKTTAIMPVHYAGLSCKMDQIMELAEKHNLKVIEDSAECIGGTFKGRRAGSFGTGCFSFYPTKNMTTGEGGMITTNDEKLAANVRTLRAHGISSTAFQREKQERPWFRAATMAGYNYRMSDIIAAIGIVQLKKVPKMNELRRQHAAYLTPRLSQNEGISPPVEDENYEHVYQMYTVKLNGIDRTKFIKYLRENGVEASVHFDPPVHLQPYYKDYVKKGELPITEKVSENIVTLPMYPQLTKEELDYMIETIEAALKKAK